MAEVISDKGNTVPEKRCATCCHWYRFGNRGVRGTCEGIHGGEHEEDGHIAQFVVSASDDTDLRADLMTTGDFGCVLHKEKA